MNILLINQYAGSPLHGREHRPYLMSRHWQLAGHHPTIVSASYAHLRLQNPSVGITARREAIGGIEYLWIPTPRYTTNGTARAANIFTFSSSLLARSIWLARTLKPDIVISSSTHALDFYGARAIASRSGAFHVHEVHDLWPLTLIELAGMRFNHPFVKLLQRAEDSAYAHADLVVSMLPGALPYMRSHGLQPSRYVHIPNGVDLDEWATRTDTPQPHAAVLERLRCQGKFVVGYMGGFAYANDVETLLLAAQRMSDPAHVVLVGEGAEKEGLQKRLSASNVTFLPPVRHAHVPAILDRFDVCFTGGKRSSLYRYGVSQNKVFDYMMAARPIVSAVEAYNDPVAESGAGLSVPSEDPGPVARAVMSLASETSEQRRGRGEAGRRYVMKHHSYSVLAERFLRAVEERSQTHKASMFSAAKQ